MAARSRIRDPDLLAAIDGRPRTAFTQHVRRVVNEKRSPFEPSSANGRWDLGHFDTLYASLDRECAVTEVECYLELQPVFPSKLRHACYELSVDLSPVLRLETLDELASLGVDRSRYRERLYDRTAEIGDAAAFLGFEGIIVPSARCNALNVAIFLEAVAPERLDIVGEATLIDWRQRRLAKGKS